MATSKRIADLVERAHGEVLIAGLRPQTVLPVLLKHHDIDRVFIIEKSKEFVGAFEKDIAARLHKPSVTFGIILDDVVTMELPKRAEAAAFMFDVIYFDLPALEIAEDNLKEISRLKRRFKPFLKKSKTSWMGT